MGLFAVLVAVCFLDAEPHAMTRDAASAEDTAPPVAVTLLWWEGDLRVSTDPEPPEPPKLLPLDLSPGDVMHVGDGARCWFLDSRQGLMTIDVRGTYRYQEQGWMGSGPIRVIALPEGPVSLRPLWPLISRPTARPYEDEEAVLLEPVETGINTLSLHLKWAPPSGGERVTVNLWRLEADGGLRLLETWRDLTGPELHSWTELERGQTYLWRVRSIGVSERMAWFFVLSAEGESRLANLVRLVKTATENPSARHGMEASLMSRMGLYGEAEIRWRSLSLSRPDRPVTRRSAAGLANRSLKGPRTTAYPPLPFGLLRPFMVEERSGQVPP